jgi:hypothetical protein
MSLFSGTSSFVPTSELPRNFRLLLDRLLTAYSARLLSGHSGEQRRRAARGADETRELHCRLALYPNYEDSYFEIFRGSGDDDADFVGRLFPASFHFETRASAAIRIGNQSDRTQLTALITRIARIGAQLQRKYPMSNRHERLEALGLTTESADGAGAADSAAESDASTSSAAFAAEALPTDVAQYMSRVQQHEVRSRAEEEEGKDGDVVASNAAAPAYARSLKRSPDGNSRASRSKRRRLIRSDPNADGDAADSAPIALDSDKDVSSDGADDDDDSDSGVSTPRPSRLLDSERALDVSNAREDSILTDADGDEYSDPVQDYIQQKKESSPRKRAGGGGGRAASSAAVRLAADGSATIPVTVHATGDSTLTIQLANGPVLRVTLALEQSAAASRASSSTSYSMPPLEHHYAAPSSTQFSSSHHHHRHQQQQQQQQQ